MNNAAQEADISENSFTSLPWTPTGSLQMLVTEKASLVLLTSGLVPAPNFPLKPLKLSQGELADRQRRPRGEECSINARLKRPRAPLINRIKTAKYTRKQTRLFGRGRVVLRGLESKLKM